MFRWRRIPDPPIWLAYINCVKRFGFDSLMDGYVGIDFDDMANADLCTFSSPEKELVKIPAEETDLTVIDPLEIPPMGDYGWNE
jgi:hypothetical protein